MQNTMHDANQQRDCEREWDKEVVLAKGRPRLLKALARCFFLPFAFFGVLLYFGSRWLPTCARTVLLYRTDISRHIGQVDPDPDGRSGPRKPDTCIEVCR
ncbi:hypothetical protein AMECASPLE_037988 [Ameca splendens]|uniref:Transmembrane protein n=1 Tax=Ameca splendens TaxID=208324 RepID=A0ABV0YJ73_9TELE